ncbi:MAG: hypothetical protein HY043_03875 [Verrucomicrobia bacterium]|nr:hypothetical protein [Verrucomicrobiota bacterium]
MPAPIPRRQFFQTAATGALGALGGLDFLARLPRVTAAEARLETRFVQFRPEIEPLVRLLEETPRERLLEEVGRRIQRGLSYREVLSALLLAGVRNVQPRPVGFKFHAVLVVNSAHLASLASPETDRWLPIFWALDYFKDSQARNAREGNWHLGPVEETTVPSADKAKAAFVKAMEAWDVAGADAAVVGLARSAPPGEVFETFCRFGARDFREIGHKAIYVANSWRTLQHIGWQHAEPVLRSLAYALLDYNGENPAGRAAPEDRSFKRNRELAAKIRNDWLTGKLDAAATTELLQILRAGSENDACDQVVALLNRGCSPQPIWDALFASAGELLMRDPGIISLHAVTSTNAFHFAFQTSKDDTTRRLLLLQNAAFVPLFRSASNAKKSALRIDEFEPFQTKSSGADAIGEIFATVSHDKLGAARRTLAYLKENPDAKALLDTARRLIFLKGDNPHDYKFSAAVLEDYGHVSTAVRAHFLVASMFYLHGSADKENDLVKRTRGALAV